MHKPRSDLDLSLLRGYLSSYKIDQLKQLGQLRESGILTDAEFETQKQKILNS